MAGNVWEWVNDNYAVDYYNDQDAEDENPTGPQNDTSKVLRGGGWQSVESKVRAADRDNNPSRGHNDSSGFRCARSVGG